MPLSDAWIDFLAGWCSGAAGVIACQPVDTVLTRLQAGQRLVTAAATTTTLVSSTGMTSLWRGSSAMIGAVPLQNSLLMGGYGLGKRWSTAQDNQEEDKLTAVFVGGCVGGLLQSFIMSPVELLKVHQQVHTERSALAVSKTVFQQIVQQKIVWRGLGATILRDGIPHGAWFVAYEVSKHKLEETFPNQKEEEVTTTTNWSIPLTSGACAATVAWGIGYPFDLIKTRIQASNNHEGILKTTQTLIQEANGDVLQGLYRGFGLKLVRSVPASMIGFTTYEIVKEYIEGL